MLFRFTQKTGITQKVIDYIQPLKQPHLLAFLRVLAHNKARCLHIGTFPPINVSCEKSIFKKPFSENTFTADIFFASAVVLNLKQWLLN